MDLDEAVDLGLREGVADARAIVIKVGLREGAVRRCVVCDAAEADVVVGAVEEVDVLAGVICHEVALCVACGLQLGMGCGGRDDLGFGTRGGLDGGGIAAWGGPDGGEDTAT